MTGIARPWHGFYKNSVFLSPLLVGAVALGLTLWAWRFVGDIELKNVKADFDFRILRIDRAIDARLMAYEQTLRAGVALFYASYRVDRDEWRTFVESLRIEENYPGLLGIGFAERIGAADTDAHNRRIRSEGFSDYRIWPAGERPEYSAVVYLEPFNNRNVRAFGYDMMTDPVKRAAMARARDTGIVATSGKVTLVPEIDEDAQAGFLTYLPVYRKGRSLATVADRRDALLGWVFSPFRMNDLIQATLEQMKDIQHEIAIAVHDGDAVSDESLMYRSAVSPASPLFTLRRSFEHSGRAWTLDFANLPAFEENLEYREPRIVLFAGLVITLLLMIQVRLLVKTRSRALALARDMTGALGQSEERLRGIMDNMSEGVITFDQAGIVESVNHAVTGILGYMPEEVLGRSVNVMIPEPDRDRPGGSIENYLRSGTGIAQNRGPREYSALHKNGTTIPISLSINKETTRNEPRFIGVMRNFAEHRRMERVIRESEIRFRGAFESAGHGVALVGLDGRWLDVNETLCKLAGYDRKQLLATDSETITHPDDLNVERENNQLLLAGKVSSCQAEKRYIRKDGSEVPVILSVGLVRNDKNAPVYFVHQIVDISKWKESEAKFLQAQKMEAVGQLTGGIAHDFNNILGVILGNLQLLQRRIGSEARLQSMTEAAITATRRGADLTKQLLAFSRRQELAPRVIDANEFVGNMDGLLRRTLGETVEIETAFGDGLGLIKADPAQFESALLNLSLNARDAMPNGGRLLIETSNEDLDDAYVRRHPSARAGRHVCISVTDSGTGIPPELREKIFEPFFTTKEVGKGTGLGLSMVFGFVKQSGGHINVYSEEGQGTRFRIYFPRTDQAGAALADDKADSADLPSGTETVLLVEDEPEFRKTAALLLEDLGYTVVGAADGPSALKSLESYPGVDILFTDMIMPGGMNGHQLAERARALRPGLPVLLTSGYPRDSFDKGRHFPLLPKPYINAALARAVRAALDGRKDRVD